MQRSASASDDDTPPDHGAPETAARGRRLSGPMRLGVLGVLVAGLGTAAAITLVPAERTNASLAVSADTSLAPAAAVAPAGLRAGIAPVPQGYNMAAAMESLSGLHRVRSSGTVEFGGGSLFESSFFGPSMVFVRVTPAEVPQAGGRGMPLPAANPLFSARIPGTESGPRIALPDPGPEVVVPLPQSNPLLRSRRDIASLGTPERPVIEEPGIAPKGQALELPAPGSGYAIYDIKGKMVYMPNGERLEAHSGYGDTFDDARYVHKKMVGPTPPNVYSLRMREALFHGVEAIRLTPVGGGKMYGRDGFLAHTYLMGPRGDSNGCVSFKDYDRFLAAFRRGEIKRLVVVAQLDNAPAEEPGSLLSWLLPKSR